MRKPPCASRPQMLQLIRMHNHIPATTYMYVECSSTHVCHPPALCPPYASRLDLFLARILSCGETRHPRVLVLYSCMHTLTHRP